MALKLFKPLPKGTYVLVEMPDERKEVCLLTEVSYKISFDVEGIPVVLRKATLKEIKEYEKKLELEEKGKEFCLQFAKELGLEMNLVRVDCFFDRSKIIFFYTAEGRIDFRQLVKELARALRMRIEMRQIGVRNETAILGGIGYCGREFCCARFLKSFTPLSIKFAKEQGLILDPNKISGPCGRLLCCLSYEME
ncbi:MAG TPA: stage 0 sporulation protein, partial [Thermodesulfobacterium commune]|nr:stage 0 sporulation protein [Thermodesulfobacterium commune]